MADMIYRCWTKATTREQGNPRHSANWIVSRRGWFRIFPDRVECGDWVLPVTDIERAMLYRGRQLWTTVRVLELQTKTLTYQFGFNPWVAVESHLPFPFSGEKVRLKHSIFSLVVRLVLIACLAFLLWQWLS